MSTIKEEIAKNILFYRKRAGYTQKELARLLGVNNSAVSNWENGLNSIDIETLFKACEIFNITLNDIYGKYADKEKSTANNGSALTDMEQYLLDGFRELTQQGQDYMIQTLHMALNTYKKAADSTAASAGNVG